MEFNGDDLSISAPVFESIDSIKVLVRVRPLSDKEVSEENESVVDILNEQVLRVTSLDGKRSFQCAFDAVLGPSASQAQVYDIVKSCTHSVLDGFNSTVFAYGQTGSGKTYSMYGPPNYAGTSKGMPRDTEFLGLIPRAVSEVFEMAKNKDIIEFSVYCSFVQIYNENLFDMLRDSTMVTPLSIREDKKEIYVQGLSEYHVKSVADTLQLLKIAEENRAIRETHMNQFSSRSHSIFQIYVEQKRVADDGGEISYRSKFNMVDLAGSEKWNTRQFMKDAHIAEMTNINLSLHTLGKCISSLAQISIQRQKEAERQANINAPGSHRSVSSSASFLTGLNGPEADVTTTTTGGKTNKNRPNTGANASSINIHVPYRDSKLTRLLQDSLGGNAKTFLIATISPARINCEESISTLKFADRAKQVMVQATINEIRPVDHEMVKRLQKELESLKLQLKKVMEQNQQYQQIMNETSGGGEGGLGASGSFEGPRQSLASPNKKPGGGGKANSTTATNTSWDNSSSSGGGGGGGDLNTITSLEKALNKEQIHSQHLQQKNETLIKELEELKNSHFQLIMQQNQEYFHQYRNNDPNNYMDPNYRFRTNPNSLEEDPTGRNHFELGNKGKFNVQVAQQQQVQQQQTSESTLPPGTLPISQTEATQVLDSVHTLMNQNDVLWEQCDTLQKIMKKFYKFQLEEDEMKEQCNKVFDKLKDMKASKNSTEVAENLSILEHISRSSGSEAALQRNTGASNGKPSNVSKHAGSSTNVGSLSHAVSLPQIGTSPAVNTTAANAVHSARQHINNSASAAAASSALHPPRSHTQPEAITFRVRGGPDSRANAGTVTPSAAGGGGGGKVMVSAVDVNSSLRSSGGGWMINSEDEEQEEERLKQELKAAKKKAKKEQKLREWQQQKEERAMQEARQLEEEKKAMKDAELMREEKRKEYASKQKGKLNNYQQKIKEEAEKIQELLNLGIDPKSLNF